MRVRGAGLGWKTLSRLALIGVIGSGAAACSTDASRLSSPFGNPFASNEPSATGSLGEDGETAPTRAPAIRTPRIQSQELAAPGATMTPRLPASARVAASAPAASQAASGSVAGMNPAGMNPDAGRMTPRLAPAAPQPKLVFGKGPGGADKAAEKKAIEAKKAADRAAEKAAEAKREAEQARKEAAREEAEAKKAHASKKAAETKKSAETKKAGETRKVADAKAEKVDRKEAAKAEEARLAKADAAKEARSAAAKKVAEAKAAEAAAKAASKEAKEARQAAKEPAKDAEKPAPVKVASADPVAPVAAAESNESFRWPAKGRVINGYGSSGNEGINIAMPEGTPVKAAEDGTVAYAGSDVKGYGKLVLVRHANGFVSAYAHNGELDVRPGEKVKRGQTIAKSGATGNVTSPQLHFEIRKGATPVDPIPHLASN